MSDGVFPNKHGRMGKPVEWSMEVDISGITDVISKFMELQKNPEIKFHASIATIEWLSKSTTSDNTLSPLSAVPLIRWDILPDGAVLETRDGEIFMMHKIFDPEADGGREQNKNGDSDDADQR